MRLVPPTALKFFGRFIVSSGSYLPKLAVSVYVLLFVFAIWSVIAASSPGSGAIASGVVGPQLAACELGSGPAEEQAGSQAQSKDRVGNAAGGSYAGWLGAGMQDVYSCALLMGASYN